jgi:hypothetical protein
MTLAWLFEYLPSFLLFLATASHLVPYFLYIFFFCFFVFLFCSPFSCFFFYLAEFELFWVSRLGRMVVLVFFITFVSCCFAKNERCELVQKGGTTSSSGWRWRWRTLTRRPFPGYSTPPTGSPPSSAYPDTRQTHAYAPPSVRIPVNPHNFHADPDPAFNFNTDPSPAFHFYADPDPAPHQSDANLRPLVYSLHCERPPNGPSGLHFGPLKLLNFDFGSGSATLPSGVGSRSPWVRLDLARPNPDEENEIIFSHAFQVHSTLTNRNQHL